MPIGRVGVCGVRGCPPVKVPGPLLDGKAVQTAGPGLQAVVAVPLQKEAIPLVSTTTIKIGDGKLADRIDQQGKKGSKDPLGKPLTPTGLSLLPLRLLYK